MYMEPEKSKELVRWAGANFTTALFVNYDPVRLVVVCCCMLQSKYIIMCDVSPRVYNRKSLQLPYGFYTRHLDRMT